jgi:hypothetical protein
MEEIGGIKWFEWHEWCHDRLDGMTAENVRDNQEYYTQMQEAIIVELQKTYGIDEKPAEGENEEWNYWKWYTFWKKWYNALDDKEEEFVRRENAKEDVSEFLPKTSWNE